MTSPGLAKANATGEPLHLEPPTAADLEIITGQLGRTPRGVRAVAARCPSGHPSVIQTSPRLADGTPFPTLYYLTCPGLTALVSTLEAGGVMREMSDRLSTDPELADRYRHAHRTYLATRNAIEDLGTDFSGGGMPSRVKCLHVHVAHTLACGTGINPFGDETLALIGDRWPTGDCAAPTAG